MVVFDATNFENIDLQRIEKLKGIRLYNGIGHFLSDRLIVHHSLCPALEHINIPKCKNSKIERGEGGKERVCV